MLVDKKKYYCEKCNRSMNGTEFYTSNNLEKYPNDGKLPQCRKCITMHVDNWNPDSFLWILQEIDIPWIPAEWDKLMERYGKDRSKVTGTTILGRYAGKMRLTQYRDYRWKDNDRLREMADKQLAQSMQDSGYDTEAIAAAVEKQNYVIPDHEIAIPVYEDEPEEEIVEEEEKKEEEVEDYFEQEDIAETIDLTDEDRMYLRLKWGKYRPEEWVRLEQLYNDMMESYDIQQAGHIDTLKLICKTSLKANQLLDIGDKLFMFP